ncbi:MAG: NTP transferase domain-containing protein [Thaumarchaeota archaeon]|nr:NTP transferase domain-containing protein [Nitrososphaerota archaeon]MDE1832093.1 NTP transferase domain-containing protein [Nitrososphaerota archaeon]MDE1841217.1 NTP transferase domain-containing protein [Nitrososphaerota archaeon]MDE1878122.1 NTP transferase domain-containing protein [Nitrososphaerota archaeon]
MIGLVMCGGKGTRMKSSTEKLLLLYKKPLIEHVLNALENSEIFSNIVCATSNNAPRTREFVSSLGFDTLETNGNGYVADLGESLLKFNEPIFVTSGDMPLLDPEIIKKIVKLVNEENVWTSILIRKNFLQSLGLEAEFFVNYGGEEYVYTGISIVDPKQINNIQTVKESFIILDDKRIAINLNTKKDYDLICAT